MDVDVLDDSVFDASIDHRKVSERGGPVRDTRITRSIESGSDLLKSGANHMPVGVLDVLSAPVNLLNSNYGQGSRCGHRQMR